MAYFTALVLGLFVTYIGGWFLGRIEGNMALLLSLATLVTGIYWLADKFLFLPKRRALVAQYEQQLATVPSTESADGVEPSSDEQQQAIKKNLLAQPWWLDWTAGLFPVIALVFVLRSFA